jgi:phosphomannomutase
MEIEQYLLMIKHRCFGEMYRERFLSKNELITCGGGAIIAPINSSQLISWVCQNYDGRLFFTKIGPPAIVEAIKEKNAIMGIEETGKNIWPNSIFYGDWGLSSLKMLEIMAKENKSFRNYKDFSQFLYEKRSFLL